MTHSTCLQFRVEFWAHAQHISLLLISRCHTSRQRLPDTERSRDRERERALALNQFSCIQASVSDLPHSHTDSRDSLLAHFSYAALHHMSLQTGAAQVHGHMLTYAQISNFNSHFTLRSHSNNSFISSSL